MKAQGLVDFLTNLAGHNDKAWFEAYRATYDQLRTDFTELVQSVIDGVAAFDPQTGGEDASKSLYRINRDVRFSKDKRPYKTSFSAQIAPGGKKSGVAGYYLHIDKDGTLLVAVGFHELTPQQLLTVRTALAAPNSPLAAAYTAAIQQGFVVMTEDQLKKVPTGWPADHPQAELLKLKHAVLYREQPVMGQADLKSVIVEQIRQLYPFTKILRATLTATAR